MKKSKKVMLKCRCFLKCGKDAVKRWLDFGRVMAHTKQDVGAFHMALENVQNTGLVVRVANIVADASLVAFCWGSRNLMSRTLRCVLMLLHVWLHTVVRRSSTSLLHHKSPL